MSEGVLPLSSELPKVSEEPHGGEQATTPAKMSDKELQIRSFFHHEYSQKMLKKVMTKTFWKLGHNW